MISVSEALGYIKDHSKMNKVVSKSIEKALGLVLASDVLSAINMPPFKQSSMDGYAFAHSDKNSYKVVGEIQAGNAKDIELSEGEAVRIFTGARVPNLANTVVMQEHVIRQDDQLSIDILPKKYANVRPLGEQIETGDVALRKGSLLNEAALGFLASLGVGKVDVYERPKVSILVTGNELQKLGDKLELGQVYESNSVTLKMALHRIGIKKVEIARVDDDLNQTTKAIKKCIRKSDIVLISGGISVGDYDFVKQALENNGADEIFYKVNQRPGKPLWFGTKEKTKVFALPGNPASSLSCFYLYVLPLLKAQMGFANCHLPRLIATATEDLKNSTGKTLFLKGNVIDGKATLLTGQASSMLKSFAACNALLVIPENIELIKKGEELTYIQL
ncbi:molybdopterin molybdotransferase MoeA [Bacteroidia bacterium]|nr:molybdopterin molybdotransferase MoeA [Bacteroidia bacterium]MDB9882182.1 molybdopterin molybdotransferase MoeA [Bacteroidia bacterium]MDC1395384.1 molybdopterin molybdotransferase MoeA [Bacteroidia bacterium]